MSVEMKATIILSVIVLLMVVGTFVLRDKPPKNADLRVQVERADVIESKAQEREPQPGDRRWSNFFGSYIVMVRYERDDHYVFRVLTGRHAGLEARNRSNWSILPLRRP